MTVIDFFKTIRMLCTLRGKDALSIERVSQILPIFDSIGNGVIFNENDTARYAPKKNLQRMFNYCRGSVLARQFRTPITSASCPTTRSVEFLRTIPPLTWTWHASPKEPILRTVYTWVRTFTRVFPSSFP